VEDVKQPAALRYWRQRRAGCNWRWQLCRQSHSLQCARARATEGQHSAEAAGRQGGAAHKPRSRVGDWDEVGGHLDGAEQGC
jgi:hypothetical protein